MLYILFDRRIAFASGRSWKRSSDIKTYACILGPRRTFDSWTVRFVQPDDLVYRSCRTHCRRV